MSNFWSAFVIALTLLSIAACTWLLWATSRMPAEPDAHSSSAEHVWDEDLREDNQPLPRWWLILFYLTILFALIYLVFYPGLGNWRGRLAWTSHAEEQQGALARNTIYENTYGKFRALSLVEIAKDPAALAQGRAVFATHCAMCHGSDARGALGFPNLLDDDWVWGRDPDAIETTIAQGRDAVMPAWGAALGEDGVKAVTAYVIGLSGVAVDPALAEVGKTQYQTLCVACHGADGKGNVAMGAPNLTDAIWLYGGSNQNIQESIRAGRGGHMPAHLPLIGDLRTRLVAAWIFQNGPRHAQPVQ
jgi:cytochrome c oxidase cbb3-type subunit III